MILHFIKTYETLFWFLTYHKFFFIKNHTIPDTTPENNIINIKKPTRLRTHFTILFRNSN